MLRSSRLDNKRRRAWIGFASALTISRVVLVDSSVEAQEQQNDQSAPPQQQTQRPAAVTTPTDQQQSPSVSAAGQKHLPLIVVSAPENTESAASSAPG
jgi:hypothetical protein